MRIRFVAGWAVALGALVVATPSPAPAVAEFAPGGSFFDDDGTTHEGAIEAIAAAGITLGCDQAGEHYCPDRSVSRAEMATFLVRALGLDQLEGDAFTDVTGVHRTSVNAVAAAGITLGCGGSSFCPDLAVTRAQMASFLARALDLPGAVDPYFDDVSGVHAASIDAVAAAGITLGCGGSSFCPDPAVSRAQMASFLARALELDPIVPPPRLLLTVIDRESWGAGPIGTGLGTHEIEGIVVHHSASVLSDNRLAPEHIRSHQSYHQSVGWPDLAYHMVIDQNGNIYEGRPIDAPGDTFTAYDPAGFFLPVLEGDFDEQDPSEESLEALAGVIAWAIEEYGIAFDTMLGHRDVAATSCPGDSLHEIVFSPEFRSRVDALGDLPVELYQLGGVAGESRVDDIEAGRA